jgi:hypothetical protein
VDYSFRRQTLRADNPLEVPVARLPQLDRADVRLCHQIHCKERAFQTRRNSVELGESPTHVNQALPIDRHRSRYSQHRPSYPALSTVARNRKIDPARVAKRPPGKPGVERNPQPSAHRRRSTTFMKPDRFGWCNMNAAHLLRFGRRSDTIVCAAVMAPDSNAT